MSTITPSPPTSIETASTETASAETAVAASPQVGRLTTPDLAAMHRSLERLVEKYESNRIETIATDGEIYVAAYDAGVSRAVHEALEDLKTGRFGNCHVCRGPIDAERLRRVPYARRCTTCQRVEERRWNQTERALAGVIRARIGEPQGRAPDPSRHTVGHSPHDRTDRLRTSAREHRRARRSRRSVPAGAGRDR